MKTNSLRVITALMLLTLIVAGCSNDLSDQINEISTDASASSIEVLQKKSPPLNCDYPIGQFATYELSQGQIPEGIVMDNTGNLYVGFITGLLNRIDCDGVPHPIAYIEPSNVEFPRLLGLTTDAKGIIYAAFNDFELDMGTGFPTPIGNNGVWRIDPNEPMGANAERIPGTENILFPNAVIFDNKGNLYVTSTFGSSVWVITKDHEVKQWVLSQLLTGAENPLSGPLGANGITFFQDALYVANTTTSQVIKIPILPTGEPGEAEALITFVDLGEGLLGGLDGITVDAQGFLYVTLIADSKIYKVSPDGSSAAVVPDPNGAVRYPASLVFGKTRAKQKSLFMTNFEPGFPPGPFPPSSIGLVRLDTDSPGKP